MRLVCTKGYTRRFKSCKRMIDNLRWERNLRCERKNLIHLDLKIHLQISSSKSTNCHNVRKNHLRYLSSIDDNTRWESSTTNKFTEKQTTKDSLMNSPKYSNRSKRGYIGWLRSSKTMIDSARKIGTWEHNRKLSFVWTGLRYHLRIPSAKSSKSRNVKWNHPRYISSVDDTRRESSTTNKHWKTSKNGFTSEWSKILSHPMTGYIGLFRSSKTTIDDARKKWTWDTTEK
jgi:hypothetical protein